MWIAKWVMGALLIILILGFAFQNQHQMVQVHVWKWVSPDLPLYLIVYIGFSFGIITWLLVSILKIMQLKVECRQLKKLNKQLNDELNRLRNLSIEEAVDPGIFDEPSED